MIYLYHSALGEETTAIPFVNRSQKHLILVILTMVKAMIINEP